MKSKVLVSILVLSVLSSLFVSNISMQAVGTDIVTDKQDEQSILDVNKDNKVDVLDYLSLKNYICSAYKGYNITYDFNYDKEVNSIDIVLMKKNILGLSDIGVVEPLNWDNNPVVIDYDNLLTDYAKVTEGLVSIQGNLSEEFIGSNVASKVYFYSNTDTKLKEANLVIKDGKWSTDYVPMDIGFNTIRVIMVNSKGVTKVYEQRIERLSSEIELSSNVKIVDNIEIIGYENDVYKVKRNKDVGIGDIIYDNVNFSGTCVSLDDDYMYLENSNWIEMLGQNPNICIDLNKDNVIFNDVTSTKGVVGVTEDGRLEFKNTISDIVGADTNTDTDTDITIGSSNSNDNTVDTSIELSLDLKDFKFALEGSKVDLRSLMTLVQLDYDYKVIGDLHYEGSKEIVDMGDIIIPIEDRNVRLYNDNIESYLKLNLVGRISLNIQTNEVKLDWYFSDTMNLSIDNIYIKAKEGVLTVLGKESEFNERLKSQGYSKIRLADDSNLYLNSTSTFSIGDNYQGNFDSESYVSNVEDILSVNFLGSDILQYEVNQDNLLKGALQGVDKANQNTVNLDTNYLINKKSNVIFEVDLKRNTVLYTDYDFKVKTWDEVAFDFLDSIKVGMSNDYNSNTVTIKGVLKDLVTDEPISNATVGIYTLDGTNIAHVTTDEDGNWVANDVFISDDFIVSCQCLDYNVSVKSVEYDRSKEIYEVDLNLDTAKDYVYSIKDIKKGTIELVNYDAKGETDVTLPDYINGLKVVSLNSNLVVSLLEQGVKNLNLPSTLEAIDSYVFSVEINDNSFDLINYKGESLKTIAPYAFFDVRAKEVRIESESLKTIGDYAFYSTNPSMCKDITILTYSSSILSIDNNAFCCAGLVHLTIESRNELAGGLSLIDYSIEGNSLLECNLRSYGENSGIYCMTSSSYIPAIVLCGSVGVFKDLPVVLNIQSNGIIFLTNSVIAVPSNVYYTTINLVAHDINAQGYSFLYNFYDYGFAQGYVTLNTTILEDDYKLKYYK